MEPLVLLYMHIKSLVRSCFYHLKNIAKLRSIVSRPKLEMIIHALVSSRLDYCNALYIHVLAKPPKNACKFFKMLLLI